MTRIIICDADLFAREGIKQMLDHDSAFDVVGEAQDYFGALQCLHDTCPDVCILEIAMSGHCGLHLIRQLACQSSETPILVMSHRTERDFALRVIRAGAAGFISKDCSAQQLTYAVKIAAERRPYISETVSELIAESIVIGRTDLGHRTLSDLDFEILCLLANGASVSTAAHACDTSVSIVRARKNNIMDKLDLRNHVDLVEYAWKYNLIDHSGMVS